MQEPNIRTRGGLETRQYTCSSQEQGSRTNGKDYFPNTTAGGRRTVECLDKLHLLRAALAHLEDLLWKAAWDNEDVEFVDLGQSCGDGYVGLYGQAMTGDDSRGTVYSTVLSEM